MENVINTLSKEFSGHGHFKVSIIHNGSELSAVTTNTMAIDAGFDDCYDDEDNSGSYYESRREAQEDLVSEILQKNCITI